MPKIDKNKMLKMQKAANRQVEIEQGIKKQASGAHKTSKKDLAEKESNDVVVGCECNPAFDANGYCSECGEIWV
jgi:hypothetical protein